MDNSDFDDKHYASLIPDEESDALSVFAWLDWIFDKARSELVSLGFQLVKPSQGKEMSGYTPLIWEITVWKEKKGVSFLLDAGLKEQYECPGQTSIGENKLPKCCAGFKAAYGKGPWSVSVRAVSKVPLSSEGLSIFSLGRGDTLTTKYDNNSKRSIPVEKLAYGGVIEIVMAYL